MLLATALLLTSCKDKQSAKAVPHVSAFAPLPAGPSPVLDAPGTKSEFPHEPPVVVIWRGGGEPPKTELGVRVWKNGRVRYTCGEGATLPPDRVAAMVAAFTQAGWNPATAPKDRAAPDSACVSTSVQLSSDGAAIERRDSGCGLVPYEIQDAVDFVQSVVGPAPC